MHRRRVRRPRTRAQRVPVRKGGGAMKNPTSGRRAFVRRTALVSVAFLCAAVALISARAAGASTYTTGTVVDTSAGASPFTGCTADDAAAQQTFSTLYTNAQPETRV